MRKQAARFGAEYMRGHLVKADLTARPFKLDFGGGKTVATRTLIIASGASARWLGLPNEQKLIGHGVLFLRHLRRLLFQRQAITVIGGGDSAMEEALFLSRFATKVTIIHRREQFRAPRSCWIARASTRKSNSLPTPWWKMSLTRPERSVALKLKNLKTGKVWDFPTSAMFLGIGHEPNAKMFTGQLDTDRTAT